jgi:hypothetical protein
VRRLLLAASLAVVGGTLACAQPAPPQTPVLERWARDTFFGGYKPAASASRWDVPASANTEHGGVPVTFRTAPMGAAVELGDALRQYEIDEPFLLIIGFWEPRATGSRFVNLVAAPVSAAQWRRLWGPVTYADLQRLDAIIRDTGLPIEETRRRVLALKNAPPFSQTIIQLNPRIDDRSPRRLLCSLRFRDVFAELAPGAAATASAQPTLFGIAATGLNGGAQ